MLNCKKVLVGFLLVILIFPGCQKAVQTGTGSQQGAITPAPVTENKINSNKTKATEVTPTSPKKSTSFIPSATPSPTSMKLDDIVSECIHSTRENILKMLGDDYESIYTGAEGSYEGYHYRNGITFVFDSESDNSTVAWIEADAGVEIFQVQAGMSFDEIKEVLGQSPVFETFVEIPEIIAYEMIYKINDFVVTFLSFEEDGNHSGMTFYREYRRYVGETRNDETSETEAYWHVDEITGDLTRVSLSDGELAVVNKGFIEGRIISVSENKGSGQLDPCVIAAVEKDGVYTIYRDMGDQTFSEYRTCDDQGEALPGIKMVECKMDGSGKYIIDVTTMDNTIIQLDFGKDNDGLWIRKPE